MLCAYQEPHPTILWCVACDVGNMFLCQDKDVPLDFMSADAAHSVLTVRPPQRKRRRGAEQGLAGAQAPLRFTVQGISLYEEFPFTKDFPL